MICRLCESLTLSLRIVEIRATENWQAVIILRLSRQVTSEIKLGVEVNLLKVI